VERRPSCPRTSTSAPAFLQKVSKKLSLGIADGGGLPDIGGEPAGTSSQDARADEPARAVVRGLRPESGNQSSDRPPALCHQDLLPVLDAEKIRGEGGFQFRNGSSFHETIIDFFIRLI
jgi:hypothetical protein